MAVNQFMRIMKRQLILSYAMDQYPLREAAYLFLIPASSFSLGFASRWQYMANMPCCFTIECLHRLFCFLYGVFHLPSCPHSNLFHCTSFSGCGATHTHTYKNLFCYIYIPVLPFLPSTGTTSPKKCLLNWGWWGRADWEALGRTGV